ncbi:MAG: hypothetical protein UY71_C0043G0010 [Parcubacteria group bacterium GW2011_GWB1_52_7]|nr:MAG: hypothetical protein UY64_C0029G0007 [Parcubacteria group bacterium GW2011_GWA1_51_12]KKW27501.1 MAG: hypothetical protein UY71_C0043G0010 [Parcubacteria group bacterium GW2011_GWB1_52_7]
MLIRVGFTFEWLKMLKQLATDICASRYETGTHDATGEMVVVDGIEIPVRKLTDSHTSARNSYIRELERPPLQESAVEAVLVNEHGFAPRFITAASVRSEYHYGGNSRPRWGGIFLKHITVGEYRSTGLILLEFQEVSRVPHWLHPERADGLTLVQILESAEKRIRIEVSPECENLAEVKKLLEQIRGIIAVLPQIRRIFSSGNEVVSRSALATAIRALAELHWLSSRHGGREIHSLLIGMAGGEAKGSSPSN